MFGGIRRKQCLNPTQPTVYVDSIYDKSSWSDLTDWTTQGATAAISSNKIRFSGGNSDFLQSIGLSNTQIFKYWNIHARYIPTVVDATSHGLAIGTRSSNATIYKFNSFAYMQGQNDANKGKLTIGKVQLNLTVNYYYSSSNISFSAGDTIDYLLEYDGVTMTFTVYNVTTGGAPVSVSVTWPYPTSLGAGTYEHPPNTGRWSVFQLRGTNDLTQFTVTSNEIKNARFCVIGDSISTRFFGSDETKNYFQRLKTNYTSVSRFAGGGDGLRELLTNLYYINNYLTPRKAFMMIGTNDLATPRTLADIQTDYLACVASLEAAGITLVHSTLCPRTDGTSTLAFRNWIIATYPAASVIDTYSFTGISMPDGVHPDDAGHLAFYTQLVATGKL